MIDQPKTYEVDGVKLREQTLIEYCLALPDGHLARRELAELQRRNVEMQNLKNQVELLTKENEALITEMAKKTVNPEPALVQTATQVEAPYDPKKKEPCRFCGKPIAVGKGYWTKHLMSAHPELDSVASPQIV